MKKILEFLKKNINKVIVTILLLSFIICLLLNCALFDNTDPTYISGFEVIFGKVYKSNIPGHEIKNKILGSNPLGIVSFILILLSYVLYLFENKIMKNMNAYLCAVLFLLGGVLFLASLANPSFTQSFQKDYYKIAIFGVVGIICIMLIPLYILFQKFLPKLKEITKKDD